jgi:lipid A 3-O-deacylase
MQKQGLFSWTGRFFLLEIIFGLGWGISRGAAAEAVLTNTPPVIRRLDLDSRSTLKLSDERVWEGDVGDGFHKGAHEVGFALSAGLGIRRNVLGGSRVAHDLALASAHYGRVFSEVVGRDHWYRGNWEWRAEGFAGAQYSPRTAYLAGVAGILRYNFITGTRLVPFFDLGAGCLATDIKQPDLSSVFQFNEQGGPGLNYFWRDHSAITFQARYLHISNAGIKHPNAGANIALFSAGMSWFF